MARFLAGRHCLIPFPRPEDIGIAAEVCQSFIIDNGAFSIWKNGGTLDVQAYADFCLEWSRHPAFDWCLIPDVIDGTAQQNYKLSQEWRGLAPLVPSVPVWHYHEDLSLLQAYASLYPVVALGSSGQWPTPGTDSWWKRTADALECIIDEQGRPKCKLHGLRMLNQDIFQRMPLHSADSTNAVRNSSNHSRFGSYLPFTTAQRMTVIADRIEAHQSAAVWSREQYAEMWQLT